MSGLVDALELVHLLDLAEPELLIDAPHRSVDPSRPGVHHPAFGVVPRQNAEVRQLQGNSQAMSTMRSHHKGVILADSRRVVRVDEHEAVAGALPVGVTRNGRDRRVALRDQRVLRQAVQVDPSLARLYTEESHG